MGAGRAVEGICQGSREQTGAGGACCQWVHSRHLHDPGHHPNQGRHWVSNAEGGREGAPVGWACYSFAAVAAADGAAGWTGRAAAEVALACPAVGALAAAPAAAVAEAAGPAAWPPESCWAAWRPWPRAAEEGASRSSQPLPSQRLQDLCAWEGEVPRKGAWGRARARQQQQQFQLEWGEGQGCSGLAWGLQSCSLARRGIGQQQGAGLPFVGEADLTDLLL
mmetsp:Transcript_16195/g.44288  ORF Transcript_16195/g.44288 Transcript_16195/m.44288 type:complete len:222 (-) Transcript_16195:124-789(-)